ncbi:MAG: glycosyltransferase [Candidatus Shapirobacteria bacterium]|nr:glycosyltransferase [Candidatus Shapirobacteria bacterium]
MFIIQITSTYPPSINGVAIGVEKISEELKKKGHYVIVIAPNNFKKNKSKDKIIRYSSVPNPVVKDYPLPLYPNFKKIIKILGNKKPDIIHVHDPFYIGNFAKKMALYYKIPLVFTYHTRYDDYAQNYLRFLPGQIKKKLVMKKVDGFCKDVDLIISNSESIKQELLHRIPELKVATIPFGLPVIPKVNLSKKETRDALNLPKDKKILLVVCRLAKEKNVPLLIKSLKKLNDDYFLMVVGGGEYQKQLEKIAIEEKVINRIKFFGPIEHHKLGIFYQTADIFTYSSITETQGLIFLEALSFNLPIVAVDCEAAREWVLPGGGILAQNNPKDFSIKVKLIEKHDKTEIAKKATKVVSKSSSQNMIEKMLIEYNQIKKST